MEKKKRLKSNDTVNVGKNKSVTVRPAGQGRFYLQMMMFYLFRFFHICRCMLVSK